MSRLFFTYMLRCSDNSFYVGHTDNLEKRLSQHQIGEGCSYTSSRLPINMVWSEGFTTREEAKIAEKKLKGWNRNKKEALIEGRFDLISKLAGRGAESRALRDALSKAKRSSLRQAQDRAGTRNPGRD